MTEHVPWMDRLSKAQQETVLTRFNQRPAEWPAGMIEAANEIMHRRGGAHCSEDVIDILAEYVATHPEEQSLNA